MKKAILRVPNPVLRAKSAPVDLVKDVKLIKKYVADLSETLVKKTNPKGVGLSMPQIGKNVRMFATYLPVSANEPESGRPAKDDDSEKLELTVYLNPVMLEASKELTFGPDKKDPILEGCLSIPAIYGPVPRYTWVRLGYETPDLTHHEDVFYGFFARVIQHEHDHLNGILFTDYVLRGGFPLYEMRGEKMEEIDPAIARSF